MNSFFVILIILDFVLYYTFLFIFFTKKHFHQTEHIYINRLSYNVILIKFDFKSQNKT